jgi:glycerol-3-phosphate cytidylyltransferase
MITVLTYGTYDLLHAGHIRFLKRARAMGHFLIVGLSTDHFNNIKGKKAFYSYARRKEILESIRYVTKVIPERTWAQKATDIRKYGAACLVQTSDWKGKFDRFRSLCEVIYLPRTRGISTSLIKSTLHDGKCTKKQLPSKKAARRPMSRPF